MSDNSTPKRHALDKIVCPHCWTTFPPEDVLWIAESPSLIGDFKLGESERERFLPTEYDARGFAIDSQGAVCREYACPHCHLPIPAVAMEAPTIFMSIAGAPASGKSYYLASSTWFLRKLLPKKFKLDFSDADSQFNRHIQEYEAQQFLSGSDRLVELEKTAEQGDLYNSVQYDDQVVVYPQPFMFLLSPAREHPNRDKSRRLSRAICLYDNAGESYLPTRGADSWSRPFTRHLGESECVFFLFDPTQDARFREALGERGVSADAFAASDQARRSPLRQEAVFNETVRRIRSARGLAMSDRFDKLLIVIVTKLDAWIDLMPSKEFRKDPVSGAVYQGNQYSYLRLDRVKMISERVRSILARRTPEFVSAAESFAENVVYIPVSATGCAPKVDRATGKTGFRACDVKPIWIVTPMLYALSQLTQGVVPAHSKSIGTAHESE